MAEHNVTGTFGEDLAVRHLLSSGYAILERNYRRGKLEADIIAYREGLIVFVEVKTRQDSDYGDPEDFVTLEKQRAYIRLADHYVTSNDRDEEVRFDIIAITVTPEGYTLNHLEDAFSAIGLF